MKTICNFLYNILFMIIIANDHTASTEKVKRNIIFIIIDDLRYEFEYNITPNVKKLAEKSVSFENAFAQQALCAPSRSSMLTGRRPDNIHTYDLFTYWRNIAGNFTTLPQYFKERGYNTFSVGKVFHPGLSSNYSDDFPYSWSHYPYHPFTQKYKDAPVCKDNDTGEFQKNLICPVDVEEQPKKTLPDYESLRYAINILNLQNQNKPYFMAVGFHKPHIPLKFPKQYMDRVPIELVQPPKHPSRPKNLPLAAWHPWLDVKRRDDIKKLNISFPFGEMPTKWTLKIKQSYLAAVSYIDYLIGVLMEHVNMNNTLVVLTSDHGWSLGENGLWAKYSNFDVALRVPLIIYSPNIKPKTVKSPVELIDIFPTLVEMAEFKDYEKCDHTLYSKLCFDGKSLLPIIQNKIQNANDDFAISQYPRPSAYPSKNSDKPKLKDIKIMGYSIRTNRFRYTEWILFNHTSFARDWSVNYGIELYDHIYDKDEFTNLESVLKYRDVKMHLSRILRSKIESSHYQR